MLQFSAEKAREVRFASSKRVSGGGQIYWRLERSTHRTGMSIVCQVEISTSTGCTNAPGDGPRPRQI